MIENASLAFVFATRMEADPFAVMVNAEMVQTEPWPVYQAEIASQRIIIIVTGMGMSSAKKAIEFIIENYVINSVYNCGVAGSLCDELVVGDIVNVTRSWIYQAGEFHEIDYPVSGHTNHLKGYLDGVLLTIDRPVFDRHQKKFLSGVAQLVDMEGGIIAILCKQNNIPCQLIKVISDFSIERNQLALNLGNVSKELAYRLKIDITGLFSQEMTA